MAIPDAHALPETEAACTEYVTEGDHAWDNGDADHAYDIYHSLFMSHVTSHEQRSHVAFRLGAILLNRGERDTAFGFLHQSDDPAAHELMQSIDNSTPNDPTPDPNTPPATLEQAYDWLAAAQAADQAGDHERAAGLFIAVATSHVAADTMIGLAEMQAGAALLEAGHTDTARQWLESALPKAPDEPRAQRIRDLLHRAGGQVADDHTSQGAEQVAHGVQAYEAGDAAAARTAFEASLHLDGSAEVKGRAHYYLGAMDYQARHYAPARDHVEAAVAAAPEPERSWAHAMLEWRWDENPDIPPNPY